MRNLPGDQLINLYQDEAFNLCPAGTEKGKIARETEYVNLERFDYKQKYV